MSFCTGGKTLIYFFIVYAIFYLIWNAGIKSILVKIKKSEVVNESFFNTIFTLLSNSTIIFSIPRFLFIAFSVYTLSTYTTSPIYFLLYVVCLLVVGAPVGIALFSIFYIGIKGSLLFILYGVLMFISKILLSFIEKDVEIIVKRVSLYNYTKSKETSTLESLEVDLDMSAYD